MRDQFRIERYEMQLREPQEYLIYGVGRQSGLPHQQVLVDVNVVHEDAAVATEHRQHEAFLRREEGTEQFVARDIDAQAAGSIVLAAELDVSGFVQQVEGA